MVCLGLIVIDIDTCNVSMRNKEIDKKIRKQREKEGCQSTRSTPSEGIEMDQALNGVPYYHHVWLRVILVTGMLDTRVCSPHDHNLDVHSRICRL